MEHRGFISRLVHWIGEQPKEVIERSLIIVPSRRAMLFIQTEMAQQFKEGWLPEMQVIDSFVRSEAKLKQADSLLLVFELYKAYQRCVEQPEPFQEFLRWGGQLLSEYVEVDNYLVDASKLYNHVKEAKLIERWSPDQKPGEMLTSFAEFFEFQGKLYQEFREQLLEQNLGHQGMLITDLISNGAKQFEALGARYKKVWFAGFNALTPAEEALISKLKEYVSLEMLWDIDQYYLRDEQEAGLFLRQQTLRHGRAPIVADDFKKAKLLTEVVCPKEYVQTKAVGALVEELIEAGENPNDIAVVLANESLLESCLSSLPDSVAKINVSMGYPLRQTLHYRIMQSSLTAFRNASRKSERGKNLQYYYKNILQIAENPLLTTFYKEGDEQAFTQWVQKIRTAKVPFMGTGFLRKTWTGSEQFMDQIAWLLPEERPSVFDLLQKQSLWLDAWVEEQLNLVEKDEFALEAAAQLKKFLNLMMELQEQYEDLLDPEAMYFLWQQVSSSYQVSFLGEPLEGLQVLGVLETRLLDFKNVIIVSTNEGDLPKKRKESPFIPYDIKLAYGLPHFEYREAIYANHIYRLVQHADRAIFVYHTDAAGGRGEPSRFVRQMIHELPSYSNLVRHDKRVYQIETIPDATEDIFVENEGKVNEAFESLLQRDRALSPSTLSKFQSCSLRFYFEKLAFVREGEEIREELAADLFGTLVHNCLEDIYRVENGKVDAEHLKKALKNIDEHLKEAVERVNIDKDLLVVGNNEIVMELARLQLEDFLKLEIKAIGSEFVEVISLEDQLEAKIDIEGKSISLFGYADRIDRFQGKVRVIDYKTGKVDDKEVSWKRYEENDWDKQGKALQLMCYLYLLDQNRSRLGIGPKESLVASIATLKSAGEHFMTLTVKESKKEGFIEFNEEMILQLTVELKGLIKNLIKTVTFEQREADQTCGYCAYSQVCKRAYI